MFGLGKLLGGKAKELKVASKKIENRNLMEAVTGGMLLLGYCEDGKLSEEKRLKIEGLLRTNASLAAFGSEMTDYFNQVNASLQAGYIPARIRILREIAEVKSSVNDAQDVLGNVLEIAVQDGISPSEEKELTAIAQTLGLNLADFMR
ncbi:TerB family tellurite resistance protein [Aeromonas hydrophila]